MKNIKVPKFPKCHRVRILGWFWMRLSNQHTAAEGGRWSVYAGGNYLVSLGASVVFVLCVRVQRVLVRRHEVAGLAFDRLQENSTRFTEY